MKYHVTNTVTGTCYPFEFDKTKPQLRAWLNNTSSSRAEEKIYRDVYQYKIDSFLIETDDEHKARTVADKVKKKLEVSYVKVENGKVASSKKKSKKDD